MTNIESTQWLKNPLHVRYEGLEADSWVTLKPYYGSRRRLQFRRTHYSIGSDPSNDFKLDDPFVSKRHAEFKLLREGYFLVEDLGSKNGIFLNGTRVIRAILPNRGVLRIGRSSFSWNMENESVSENEKYGGLTIQSESMRALAERIRVAASSKLPVLFLGETGTGKDEFAKLLHAWSDRVRESFIAINAATVAGNLVDSELFGHKKGAYTGSENNRLGAIQAANRGVLFLDELGDLPLDTQAKLLRVLETGEVKPVGSDVSSRSDFRLVAATSKNLNHMVARGEFRLDLFYRVSGFVFQIPPLRERKEEVVPIARAFAEGEGLIMAPECEGKLISHEWPGNIRELRAVVSRAMTMCRANGRNVIQADDIELYDSHPAARVAEQADSHATLEDLEREFIKRTLERTGWSKVRAAHELGIARSTLFEKMKKYKISGSVSMLVR